MTGARTGAAGRAEAARKAAQRRQRSFNARMKGRGYKRVAIWVRQRDVEALRAAARQPRALARLRDAVKGELKGRVAKCLEAQLKGEAGGALPLPARLRAALEGDDAAKDALVAWVGEAIGIAVGTRRRLPNRRFSENRKLFWAGRTIYLTVGYADGVEPKEVFYADGYRSGSDMEALVSDLCIMLSVVLQREGVTVQALRKSMGQTFDARTGDPMPASILGLLLEELSRPPEWAGDLERRAEGQGPGPADESEISGEAEVDPRAAGEAGRPGNPAPDRAARHHPEEHGSDGPAGEEAGA